MVSEFNELIKPQVYHRDAQDHQQTDPYSDAGAGRGETIPGGRRRFLSDGADRSEYLFCTWGTLDLTELQRNMAYYEMPLLAPGPLPYLDVQKLFAIAYEGAQDPQKSGICHQIFLHIEKRIFPSTGRSVMPTMRQKILIRILEEHPEVVVNLSYDTFCPPKDRRDEVKAQFDTYVKYISGNSKDKDRSFRR